VRILLTQEWKDLKKLAEKIPGKLAKSTQISEDRLKELHKNLWEFIDILEK
jgi:hypothetical protein